MSIIIVEVIIMIITSTEFKNKVGEYIEMAKKQEIIISKNGKSIVKIVPIEDEAPVTKSLRGAFDKAAGLDLNDAKEERLKKNESSD